MSDQTVRQREGQRQQLLGEIEGLAADLGPVPADPLEQLALIRAALKALRQGK